MFYFQSMFQQVYNGITGSAVLPAVQQIAEAILLLAALLAVYEAYAKGGDARTLALAGVRYLIMGLLISQYPNVFRNVNNAFANVAQAITAPGDVVLVPNPSYPIHAFGFLMAGGAIRSVPSEPTPTFFHTLEHAITHSTPKPIAVVVCYPANPTAYVASLDFYKDLVAFAKKHSILVLSDLAYAEVYFDDNPPPSLLQVPGAMDIAVEFTSMSKTYSMPGWRMGFAVGNERIIAALGRVKSYLDYGAFTPVQVAATAALNGPDDCIKEMRETYKRRRDVLVESFGRAGFPVPSPRASMFAWAPIPEPFKSIGSVEFATLLVEKAELAVSPGIGFGEYGEGFVRIALVENEQRIRQAARNIRRFLETGPEKLHNVVPLATRR